MRVTSSLWVSAHMRRAQIAGAFATLVSKGAEEAGAIFVIVNDLQGEYTLYGPAPQAEYAPDYEGGRLFERVLSTREWSDVNEHLDKEKRFDPDIWVVEIEDRDGRNFLLDKEHIIRSP
ncbi:MAG: DUF1491 family protein [Rhizobiaceae bacterium]